jgi:hypothetical protein
MKVPDIFLMVTPGRTIIRYALPDTFVKAQTTYSTTEHFSASGSYSVYMVLQSKTSDIFSDTLTIVIQ